MRNGREIGTVGFGEKAVERNLARHGSQGFGMFERHTAREGDEEPAVHETRGVFHRPAEAVQHAAALEPAAVLLEDFLEVRPRFAAMNDDGQLLVACDVKLANEHASLEVVRREIVVIVEADFSDSENFLLAKSLAQAFEMPLLDLR